MNSNLATLIECLNKKLRTKFKCQSGYALLEYCAGAAVVAVVLWAAMQALGDSVSSLIASIADWALARASQVSSGSGSAL